MRPGIGTQRSRSNINIHSNKALLPSDSSSDSSANPASKRTHLVFRTLTQWAFCIAAVVLGFRVAREVDLVRDGHLDTRMEDASSRGLFLQFSADDMTSWRARNTTAAGTGSSDNSRNSSSSSSSSGSTGKSSRVYVGRHPILVRPWPHPDPVEMAMAYDLLARVQLEQQRLYGAQDWKAVLAVTPMFVRTFQSVHLTGLMNTLSLVRGPVTWVVVEADGATAETAALLKQAKVHKLVHLGASKRLPRSLQDRRVLESHLRIEGLRYIRKQRLEGVVVFADDSAVYSAQFFDAVQKVQWLGTLPLAILGHALDSSSEAQTLSSSSSSSQSLHLHVQSPVCEPSSGRIKGWHAHGSAALDAAEEEQRGEREGARLEWAGFAMNARVVWEGAASGRPEWVRDWREWGEGGGALDVRDVVRDETRVEVLGGCGAKDRDEGVLLWWARVEARADSKFPPRWELDSPLEVIVPAKRTPWPDRVFPPPSPPPPPTPQTTKPKGGNRSGNRPRRGKRRPNPVKTHP